MSQLEKETLRLLETHPDRQDAINSKMDEVSIPSLVSLSLSLSSRPVLHGMPFVKQLLVERTDSISLTLSTDSLLTTEIS